MPPSPSPSEDEISDDLDRPWRNRGPLRPIRDLVLHTFAFAFLYTVFAAVSRLVEGVWRWFAWPIAPGAAVLITGFLTVITGLWKLPLHSVLEVAKLGFGRFPWRLQAFLFGNQASPGVDLAFRLIVVSAYLCLAFMLFPKAGDGTVESLLPYPWHQPFYVAQLFCSLYCFLAAYVAVRILRGYARLGAPWSRTHLLPIKFAANTKGPTARIAHLTDLHITVNDSTPTVESKPSPNPQLKKLLAACSEELAGVHAILVTGDVTDTGQRAEWRRFWSLLPQKVAERTVLIPGNHDLNLSVGALQGQAHDTFSRTARLVTFAQQLCRHQEGRTLYLTNEGLAPLETHMLEAEQDFQYFWEARARTEQEAFRLQDMQVIERAQILSTCFFPYVCQVGQGGDALNVLVLLSVGYGTNVLSNAFGQFDSQQLEKAKRIFSLIDGPVVVATHHHVGFPAEGAFDFISRSMSVKDGGYLLGILKRLNRHVVLFNGHRHIAYHAEAPNVSIVSGASSTLGDEASTRLRERIAAFRPLWDDEGLGESQRVPNVAIYDLALDGQSAWIATVTSILAR